MSASYADLLHIDSQLVQAGHHPLTAWWRSNLQGYYEHATAKTLLAMVGRGGAKSHTSAKISLTEVLCGSWAVPPGERHYWAFISASKDEADQRLRLLESFLRALGVPFVTDGDTIALSELPLGWRVFAGTIAAASGFRCIGYSVDEAAKLQIKGKNPLEEIVASLNAMCVTHSAEGARRILISSPKSKLDYFFKRWDAGNTEQQVTLHAETWTANSSLSREATLLAEPDPRYHAREYGAIPTDIEEESFFGDVLDGCIDDWRTGPEEYIPGRQYCFAIDPASKSRRDRWGYAGVTSESRLLGTERRRVTVVQEANSWIPDEQTPSNMLRKLKRDVLSRFDDVTRIFTDQDSFTALRELARGVGLTLVEVPWTGSGELSKLERFRTVRMAMLEGALRLPNNPRLLSELRAIQSAVSETGQETIRTPRTPHAGHCDAATAAVLACSQALLKPAHLPLGTLTQAERIERSQNMRRCIDIFGSAPVSMLTPREREHQAAQEELAEITYAMNQLRQSGAAFPRLI